MRLRHQDILKASIVLLLTLNQGVTANSVLSGTSKSQMLQYVHNLVPRGQYTSGKGSSATGLTAYITKDPETKHVVLQTGNWGER